MDQDLARKRKLQALAGQTGQTSSTSLNDPSRTTYYASTNPPSALPSLASFVSTNAEALADSSAELEGKVPRPVKKKKSNEGEVEGEASRQRVMNVVPGSATLKPGNSVSQRSSSATGAASSGPSSMFPLRRVDSNVSMNNTRNDRVLNDRDNDTDQDEVRHQPSETGKRGRSLSTATNILSINRNSMKADDEDSEQGYGTNFGGRGREGSVSMHSGTEAGGSGKKGKRNRVHFSCVEVSIASSQPFASQRCLIPFL